ncbi:MAG TPA: hypothetical protein VIV14_12715, partial [Gammaproteobacteria bacterium]
GWFATVVIVALAIGFPVALILAWAFDVTPDGIQQDRGEIVASQAAPQTGQRMSFLMQALVLIAVGYLLIDQLVQDPGGRATPVSGGSAANESSTVSRFQTSLGNFLPVADGILSTDVAVAPDGESFVYVLNSGDSARLYMRALDDLDARPLTGTEGAFRPFFSPDGERVGFYSDQSDQKLKTVSIRGGAPIILADAPLASGADWSGDGWIYYVTGAAGNTGGSPVLPRSLYRIREDGGPVELVLASNNERGFGTPHVLPGDAALLLLVRAGVGGIGRADEGHIDVLSLATGESHTIIEAGFAPKYVPSGHVIFSRNNDLWAVPFDLELLETTGPEVPVITGVQADPGRGYVPYAVTDDGLLIYAIDSDDSLDIGDDVRERALVWVDREGNEAPIPAEPRYQVQQRVSPSGEYATVAANLGGSWDIWTTELATGASRRLTFDAGDEAWPVWSRDGQRIAFASELGISWVSVDGTGQMESTGYLNVGSRPLPLEFLPDGRLLIVAGPGLRTLGLDGEGFSEPILETTPTEFAASVSPDGNWIAYESNETGALEIYVRPFPDVEDGKWQISDGGEIPRWSPEGGEIFYRRGSTIMTVSVTTEPGFSWTSPTSLFTGGYDNGLRANYDVAPDGERFLMLPYAVTRSEGFGAQVDVSLVMVHNWFEELRRLAPVDR